MKAAISSAPYEVHSEEVPVPEPGPGELRIKVAFCGLCGTDLHRFRGGMDQVPLAAGHEVSGTIDAIGPGVRGFKRGDRIVVEPLFGCGVCRQCRGGNTQHCEKPVWLGFQVTGGFAEYVVAPAYNVLPLPEAMSLEEGAMIEPLAVGVHAVARSGLEPGSTVGVIGSGTIGLMTLQAARAAGAQHLFATAKRDHQAKAAKLLGADAVLPADADAKAEISRLTGDAMLDVVFETIGGNTPPLQLAMQLVRPGGRVVLVGAPLTRQPVDLLSMVLNETELVGSLGYGFNSHRLRRDFEVSIDLASSHRVNVAGLITHQFPLDRIADAYQAALEKEGGLLKALIAC